MEKEPIIFYYTMFCIHKTQSVNIYLLNFL